MARLVKRYSNRKLYDTSESRYVTLDEIARWVKSGEEVKILENESGEDLTAVTFAQIILEEERKKSCLLSLRVMRELIQHGESALQGLAETVDRGIGAIRPAAEAARTRVHERVQEGVQNLTSVADRLTEIPRNIDEVVRRQVERVTRARRCSARWSASSGRRACSRRGSPACVPALTTTPPPAPAATAPRRSVSARQNTARRCPQHELGVLPRTISMIREWPYAR
jgi:polyhydroxyalkanoate synthesis repressor PhaR